MGRRRPRARSPACASRSSQLERPAGGRGRAQGPGLLPAAPAPQADWPLPGGTPEQSVENVDAAPDLRDRLAPVVRRCRRPPPPRHGPADRGRRPDLRDGRRGRRSRPTTRAPAPGLARQHHAQVASATAKPGAAASPTPTARSTSPPGFREVVPLDAAHRQAGLAHPHRGPGARRADRVRRPGVRGRRRRRAVGLRHRDAAPRTGPTRP